MYLEFSNSHKMCEIIFLYSNNCNWYSKRVYIFDNVICLLHYEDTLFPLSNIAMLHTRSTTQERCFVLLLQTSYYKLIT